MPTDQKFRYTDCLRCGHMIRTQLLERTPEMKQHKLHVFGGICQGCKTQCTINFIGEQPLLEVVGPDQVPPPAPKSA